MTNPNLVNTSQVYMRSNVQIPISSDTDILECPSGSNMIIRADTVIICNPTSSASSINVYLTRSATTYALAKTIEIPAYSSMVVLDKDYPVYLEEGDKLQVSSSNDFTLQAICSYTIISDTSITLPGRPEINSLPIESVTYLGYDTSTNNPVSPFTSGTINFGSEPTAGQKRYIVASVTFTQSDTSGGYTLPFSVTIGGNSATWVTGAQGSNLHNVYGLCYAEVPTGTSGTVAVTFTGSGGTSHLIYLHSIITNGTGTLSATDSFALGPLTSSTTTVSLDSNSGDVVIAGLVVRNGTATPTLTDTSGFGFSGWDANVDQVTTEYTSVASALTSFTGSGTFNITDTVADLSSSAIVAATFRVV